KSPSFMVSSDKQIWYCFGACGEGGDIFKFLQKAESLEFVEALNVLADKAGVLLSKISKKDTSHKSKILAINELAKKYFEKALFQTQSGKKALEYLKDRGINEKSVKNFNLGYAPNNWKGLTKFLTKTGFSKEDIIDAGLTVKSSNAEYDRFRARIIFPIFSVAGKVIGFTGRTLINEDAKYINSPQTVIYDKSNVIFGLHQAKGDIIKEDSVVIVEGNIDVVMSNQSGVLNVVAVSGTSLTEGHLKILRRYTKNLIFCFDSDNAGILASKRAIGLAYRLGFNIKALALKVYKDPADLIKGKGEKAWQNLISKSENAFEFLWEILIKDKNIKDIEVKKEIIIELFEVLQYIVSKVETSYWKQEISKRLEARESDLEEEWDNIIKGKKVKTESIKNENKLPKTSKDRLTFDKQHLVAIYFKYSKLFTDNDIKSKVYNIIKKEFKSWHISKKELKLKAEIMWPEKYLANKELNRIINDFKHIDRKQKVVSSLELENE
ncbi:MAG: DNA primase, partial [Patescibacteria group bacterium]